MLGAASLTKRYHHCPLRVVCTMAFTDLLQIEAQYYRQEWDHRRCGRF
jgi:hypothetical protein